MAQRVALLPRSSRFDPDLGLLFVWSFSCSPNVCLGFLYRGSPLSLYCTSKNMSAGELAML